LPGPFKRDECLSKSGVGPYRASTLAKRPRHDGALMWQEIGVQFTGRNPEPGIRHRRPFAR
jgi:hypothetical protein